VEFPEVVDLWPGEKFRCLGAGNRQKKIAFVGVKVAYSSPEIHFLNSIELHVCPLRLADARLAISRYLHQLFQL
jgi:hypothetical protein